MPLRSPLSPQAARLAQPVVADKILAVISGRVPDGEVDDLVQATYLRALLHPQLPDDPKRLGWLVAAIAQGMVVDFYRQRGREARRVADGHDPDEVPVDDAPSSARDPLEARETLAWIEREVRGGHLPEEILRWSRELASGATCEEIAEREGRSPSAIRVDLHRARKHLHKRWGAYLAAASVCLPLLVLFFALRRPHTERIVAVPEEHAPTPQATSSAPAPAERARAMRDDAFRACDQSQWDMCLRDLDGAKSLDPAGDMAPRVQDARKKASDELAKPVNTPRDGKNTPRDVHSPPQNLEKVPRDLKNAPQNLKNTPSDGNHPPRDVK